MGHEHSKDMDLRDTGDYAGADGEIDDSLFVYEGPKEPIYDQEKNPYQCLRCKRRFATEFNKRQHFFCTTEAEKKRLMQRARLNQLRIWRAEQRQKLKEERAGESKNDSGASKGGATGGDDRVGTSKLSDGGATSAGGGKHFAIPTAISVE